MPHIIYPDTPEKQVFSGFFNPHKLNPVKQYMKHYENFKYLRFIHDNTKDGYERRQANKEVQVADKKMQYWYKMMTFEHMKDLEEQKQNVDKQWNRR